jgi:hypothetical protein
MHPPSDAIVRGAGASGEQLSGRNHGTSERRCRGGLTNACRTAAHSEAYLRIAKGAFRPDDDYGDGAALARNLEEDMAEKRRLLGALGLLK